jgi:arginase
MVARTNHSRTARVDIIGVPMDLGASRRGVDMGPSAIRYARLHERLHELVVDVLDHGNLPVPIRESAAVNSASAKYLDVIQSVNAELALLVEESVRSGGLPIVLGGDHSVAMGTLAGLTRAYSGPPGLVWIDAHSDINNPESSPTGNVHGMPLWFALKNGFAKPETTVQIGLRDVDEAERRLLRESGVRAFSMTDVDKHGMTAIMQQALEAVGGRPIHVSFDMDAIDPSEAPGTGTPVKGGLSFREAHLAMEMLYESGRLQSIEMVEINPILDTRNQTAALAVGLICSALGKSIL